MRDSNLDDILRDPAVRAAILGLSLIVLRSGEIASVHAAGSRGPHDSAPVDDDTVFEAASTPLKTYFTPGARFSYGSSAFTWLQRAMETVTGQPLEELAGRRVFEPFGMRRSSLQWQHRFESNHARGHETDGQPLPKRRPSGASASWSLVTTSSDYARFLGAVLQARHLSPAMHARWFAPAVRATACIDDVSNSSPVEEDDVAWGLGWGLEPSQACFFHWGHNPGFRAFVMGKLATGDAVVWFANSARGLRLARRILPLVLPGQHRSVEWLQVAKTLQE
jgi:CubicO group peptidase (beta-lactamase class C family)